MQSLFTNNEAERGFRLQYLELYNWGTFGSNKPFRLEAGGKTSLLTGANGSGKTTVIDALLTLLVPKAKRFYNQSSGAESKRDRSEDSYFWGHHGHNFSEDEGRKTDQLRQKGDGSYSVLLAVFHNAATQHHITLAQVRWWSDELKRAYIFSPHPLGIETHFGKGRFDLKGQWKKDLKSAFPKTEIWDAFVPYGQKFSEVFGLKDNAASLFNQTVGIKVLGDLTAFIREHMLDEPDAEAEFGKLYEQFKNLLSCHRAIRKDEQQLTLLQPVMEGRAQLLIFEAQTKEAEAIQRLLPAWFDNLERAWLSKHIASLMQREGTNKAELAFAQDRLKSLRGEKTDLDIQLGKLDVAARIRDIDRRMEEEQARRATKQQAAKEYDALAATLGLATGVDAEGFLQNGAAIETKEARHKEDKELISRRLIEAERARESNRHNADDLQRRITSLLNRRGRISDELVSIRARLADLLSIAESELPFAGELIQVLRNETAWEEAIEKLLRPFALQLLVAEEHHHQVAQFAKSNNLGTRLVYQRIDPEAAPSLRRKPRDAQMLINKLKLKQDATFYNWAEKELLERYDYLCTDNLADFQHCDKALTSSGLIRNKSRHEKDDRPLRSQRREFVLGWNNEETIVLLGQEKDAAMKEVSGLSELMAKLKEDQKELEQRSEYFYGMKRVRSFDELDWGRHVVHVEALKQQKEELLTSSDAFQQLQQQLETVSRLIEEKDKDAQRLIREGGQLSTELERTDKRFKTLREVSLREEESQMIQRFLQEQSEMPPHDADGDAINATGKRANRIIAEKVRISSSRFSEASAALQNSIKDFIQPQKSVTDEFPDWSGDTVNFSSGTESLDEMAALYERIHGQRLVEHKEQFRRYMDESMLDALTSFTNWIEGERDKIKDVIEKLNAPLRGIVFNKSPDTYLQLEWRNNPKVEVRAFQSRLHSCVPDTVRLQKEAPYRKEAFLKIQSLINELQEKESWRREVTDARAWLIFGAQEYFKDGERRNYYENTAAISGGQKAQLTYAILGAAIAHQFGIFQNPSRSLRFITVDEAFSKLDPDKSRFLMEYCEQLHLQLLIVTPLDKINIAEPYINAVHYTEIRNARHSHLYNLTMEEYAAHKGPFHALDRETA